MRLGILIPYYKNTEECEWAFKKLMKMLEKQIGGNIFVYIYEDGQESLWLHTNYYIFNYNICVWGEEINNGIAYARNYLLYSALDLDFIMFLDSDDMIDCDFVRKMYEALSTGEYDMIISRFLVNKKETNYKKRSNVAGICLKTDFIKGLSFDERYNISEDSLFIEEVYKRNPRIGIIDSNYYYNFGINPDSLMKRYERSEIKLMKED